MDKTLNVVRSELILGGQRSGKSRRAELLAREWLAASPAHHAVLIATGQSGDDEMRARIARHRIDRTQRVPGMCTVEEPLKLAEAIQLLYDDAPIIGDPDLLDFNDDARSPRGA